MNIFVCTKLQSSGNIHICRCINIYGMSMYIYVCKCQKSGYFKVLQHSKKKLESVDPNPSLKVPMVTQY